MSHFTSFSGARAIRSGLVSLILSVRICCPKTKHFSVSSGCWWMLAWKKNENDLLRERQSLSLALSAYHSRLSRRKRISEEDFNLLCSLSRKRERELSGTVSGERHAILSTEVSSFIKCTSSLMYCQLHTFLSLPLQRRKSHLIQFDNRTGSWFEKCSSHHSRDTHNTHTHTHADTYTDTQHSLCQLSLWPASSSSICQFILLGVNRIIYGH